MAQASISIANGSGASVRSAINSALEAITTLQSGATAPSTTYPFMQWADTANDLLKQRNAANSAWIIKGTLSAEYGGIPASGVSYDPGSRALLAATNVQEAIDELASSGSASKGHIYGLTLSNNGTDADHDIDFATGEAASDDASPVLMTASSAMTKQADAPFAEGTNQGAMVSGESLPTSGTIHWWQIMKANGTVDYCCNNHASSGLSPTLPTDFIYKRRIASLRTDGSANIRGFVQEGDLFQYKTSPGLDINATNPGTSAVLVAMTVPLGIKVRCRFNWKVNNESGVGPSPVYFSSPDQTDEAPSTGGAPLVNAAIMGNNALSLFGDIEILTDTSGRIRYRATASSAGSGLAATTTGYVDTRGRNS